MRRPYSAGGVQSIERGAFSATVRGFLYFIDISDHAGLNDDNITNLKFFKKLVGGKPEVLKNVTFVITKWVLGIERGNRAPKARTEFDDKTCPRFPDFQGPLSRY